jgi:hypothetical protein
MRKDVVSTRMRNVMTGIFFNVLFAVGSAPGMSPALPTTQLFDFCDSRTIAEAEAKGSLLGWQRMADGELEEWRTGFLSYNGGSVAALGWRRGGKNGDDSLSFWVARGPHKHRACAYSAANPAKLLDGLLERFGAPATLDKYDFGTTALWKLGQMEVSFSQVGSSTVLYIVHNN